jgi:hypothetical protein
MTQHQGSPPRLDVRRLEGWLSRTLDSGSAAIGREIPKEDNVVKDKKKNAPAGALVFASAAWLLLVFFAPPAPLSAQPQAATSNGFLNFPIFNPPPFDFNDAFYTANGINVTALDTPGGARFGLFRQTGPPAQPGQVNWVVDHSNNDPDRNDIRILATTGGYIDDGTGAPTQFISIMAFLLDQTFFTGVANARGIQMADIVGNFEAYAAPKQVDSHGVFAGTACGTMGDGTLPCFPVTSVATPTLRQDWRFATNRSPIDGSAPFGYFCDDTLGMWIITYFWYTSTGFGPHQTAQCHQMLAALGNKNNLTLDGTPIIKTGDELNFLEGKVVGTNPIPGFLGTNPPSPPCTAEGQEDTGGADGGAVWLICPALPDPRNGAIALDSFLDQVRKPNGIPVDLAFTANFLCLKFFGAFCNELTPTQQAAALSAH